MSSNRLIYDTCAYKKTLDQSVGPLSYVLNPIKYENCNKCRMELGLVGGTAVSQIKGNLVDLENDLRGTTRSASSCPSKHYIPNCPNKILAGVVTTCLKSDNGNKLPNTFNAIISPPLGHARLFLSFSP